MTKIRVASYGLGPIGLRAATLAASKTNLELVGAIDIDPAKAGKDLAALTGDDATRGITVSDDAATVLAMNPDCMIHCTSSFLPAVEAQLMQVAEAGVDLVTSTEEMLWPALQHPDIAARIDAAASAGGATLLGTGVNPGFVMDTLPAFASSVLYDVRSIVCRRYVDATTRREPFQKKIGAGLREDEFRALVAGGKLGHIGLKESIALLGAAVGVELDTIEQDIQPILATRALETEFLRVAEGAVAGIHNTGHGSRGGQKLIEMDLQMYVGCDHPVDEAVFDSTPAMHIRIPGGTSGDFATAAMLVNCVPSVVAAGAGLKTMLDISPPHLLR